jgi:two-component system sensor histidine kinase KdpD
MSLSTIEQIPELPAPKERHWKRYLIDSLLALAGVAAVTLIIYAYHLYPTIPNISLVYLLLILILASTRGRFAAIVAAVVAVLAFDFFLVPPLYTFVISRWEEWIALFVFLVTALITSQLTTQTRQSVEQARLREREARILYEAGRVINMTDNLDEQLDSIVLAFVRVFSAWGVRECALLLPDKDGTLIMRADAPIKVESFALTPNEMVAAREVFAEGEIREISTSSQSASAETKSVLRLIPLKAENEILGLLCLRIEGGVSWFASSQHMQEELEQPTDQAIFFWTFLDQVVRVIEQARLRSLSNSE